MLTRRKFLKGAVAAGVSACIPSVGKTVEDFCGPVDETIALDTRGHLRPGDIWFDTDTNTIHIMESAPKSFDLLDFHRVVREQWQREGLDQDDFPMYRTDEHYEISDPVKIRMGGWLEDQSLLSRPSVDLIGPVANRNG